MIYYQASMRIEDLKKNVLTVNLRTILGSKEGLKYKSRNRSFPFS